MTAFSMQNLIQFHIKMSQETVGEKQGYDVKLFDRLIHEQSVLRGNHA